MKQAPVLVQNLSSADKIKVIVVLFFMGMLLILLGFLVGMLLRQTQFEVSAPVPATPTSPVAMIAPTDSLPAADCPSPTLTLGSTVFQIQALPRGADGSLAVPADTSGIAYQIEGTGASPVFVLSPTPQNISVMSSISVGSAARVTGPGCSVAIYSLSAPQTGALDGSVLTGRAAEEITVFFPTVSSSAGFVFQGRRTTEPVLDLNPPTPDTENTLPPPVNTALRAENTTVPVIVASMESSASPTAAAAVPTPDYSQVLAEIGLQDTSLALFGLSLKIEVSIYNFGTSPFTLTEGDVTLTQPDGTQLTLKSSKPALPIEFQPGETKTVEFSFETPASPTATLKILTVEYDIEGY